MDGEKQKTKLKQHLCHPFPILTFSPSLLIPQLPCPWWMQGGGDGVLWLVHNNLFRLFTTVHNCCSFLLTVFLCSRVVCSTAYSVVIHSTVVLHRLQRIFAPVSGARPCCPSLTLVFTLVLLTNFYFFYFFFPCCSLCVVLFSVVF